ncbi:hypothetical protein TW95_gp1492 [Pandoravirus inopinatum]|uniref:Uncharacterized protein n=1 Tax=Pandoravirus inopinatum TaxID=1605721 RepID=A0A0B5JB66_9VIRU|nr:hypothetical protein TW95_gp1492 [Pandoravirus inopinatum]AJF98226.1 hypothetical protein [Pandoravirus inopinatum]
MTATTTTTTMAVAQNVAPKMGATVIDDGKSGDDGSLVFYYRYRHQRQWRRARCPEGPRWESVRYWLECRAGLLATSASKGAPVSYVEAQRQEPLPHAARLLADDDEVRQGDALVLAVRPVVWRAHVHRPFVPLAHRRAHAQMALRGRRRGAIDGARADESNADRMGDNNNAQSGDTQWSSMDENMRIETVAMGDTVAETPAVPRRPAVDRDAWERRDDPPDVHPSNVDVNVRGHSPLCAWMNETDLERRREEQHRAFKTARLLATPDPLGPPRPDQLCVSCGDLGRHRTARCPRACEPGYRPLSDRRMPAGQPRDAFRRALDWERDVALVQFPRRGDPPGALHFFMPRSVRPSPRPAGRPLARAASMS